MRLDPEWQLTEAQYYYMSIIPYFLMLTGLVFGIFFFLDISIYITASAVSLVFGASLILSSWIVKDYLSDTKEFKLMVIWGIFFILFSIIFIIRYLS